MRHTDAKPVGFQFAICNTILFDRVLFVGVPKGKDVVCFIQERSRESRQYEGGRLRCNWCLRQIHDGFPQGSSAGERSNGDVGVPEFDRETGVLRPMLTVCTAVVIMHHPLRLQKFCRENLLVKATLLAAKAANISDPNLLLRTSTEKIPYVWSKKMLKAYQENHLDGPPQDENVAHHLRYSADEIQVMHHRVSSMETTGGGSLVTRNKDIRLAFLSQSKTNEKL
jgi:hypothetical protein